MDLNRVVSVFALLSKQSENDYFPLIQLSVSEVEKSLRTGADSNDMRLCYLSAAIANLRFIEIEAAREKQVLTVSGGVAVNSNSSERLAAAKSIVLEYRDICSDLIADNDFIFIGTKG